MHNLIIILENILIKNEAMKKVEKVLIYIYK